MASFSNTTGGIFLKQCGFGTFHPTFVGKSNVSDGFEGFKREEFWSDSE
jgi:hypothetical protein